MSEYQKLKAGYQREEALADALSVLLKKEKDPDTIFYIGALIGICFSMQAHMNEEQKHLLGGAYKYFTQPIYFVEDPK